MNGKISQNLWYVVRFVLIVDIPSNRILARLLGYGQLRNRKLNHINWMRLLCRDLHLWLCSPRTKGYESKIRMIHFIQIVLLKGYNILETIGGEIANRDDFGFARQSAPKKRYPIFLPAMDIFPLHLPQSKIVTTVGNPF